MSSPSKPAPTPGTADPAKTSWLAVVKDVFSTLQAIVTIGAFLAAAWWFYTQHFTHPQIKLDQTISQRPLEGSPGTVLVFLDVRATNIGKIPVEIQNGSIQLFIENPQPEQPLPVVPLKYRLLEPGESDQLLMQPFTVPISVKTLQITSNIPVPKPHRIFPGDRQLHFWSLKSLVDIGATEAKTTIAGTAAAN